MGYEQACTHVHKWEKLSLPRRFKRKPACGCTCSHGGTQHSRTCVHASLQQFSGRSEPEQCQAEPGFESATTWRPSPCESQPRSASAPSLSSRCGVVPKHPQLVLALRRPPRSSLKQRPDPRASDAHCCGLRPRRAGFTRSQARRRPLKSPA